MDSVEASGKSIDDAILQALARLGRRRDEVDVAVLQEPSRGHRGVGAHDARVRVWLKRPAARPAAPSSGAVLTPDMAEQWLDVLDEPEPLPPPNPVPVRPQPQPQRTASIYQPPAPPQRQQPIADEDDDEEYDDDEEFDDEEDEEDEAEDEEVTVVAPTLTAEDEQFAEAQGAAPEHIARHANEVLHEILRQMGLPATIEIASRDPVTLNVRMRGDSEAQALLIGRRGETLASLQLLVNLIVNHKGKDRYHVIVDVERYRHRRDDNLRSLALRVAQQVQQSQRSMTLEPMTPYERRIVHLALQESPAVQTQSTGEGEQRRVVVSLRPRKAR